MRSADLLAMLQECYVEKLALRQRHVAVARRVTDYDFNNTYQYVIAREETHLQWLQAALAEFRAPLPGPSAAIPVPDMEKPGRKVAPGRFQPVLEDDARHLSAFVERWTPKVAAMTHARHRIMLEVILGESREHQRLFEQAAAGFEDLLGRRTGGVARQGGVLPVRWME